MNFLLYYFTALTEQKNVRQQLVCHSVMFKLLKIEKREPRKAKDARKNNFLEFLIDSGFRRAFLLPSPSYDAG